jgi:hypothetical protein
LTDIDLGLRAAFDVLNLGNPVALPSREARLFPFTIEACRSATKERLINPFERVDADDRVEMAVDPARDHRHYAAAGAGVELSGPGTERVPGYERGILDHYLQRAAGIGGPDATMLGAKRAGAGASRNFGGIRLPGERERDVSAVALTVDQQACDLLCLRHLTWEISNGGATLAETLERAPPLHVRPMGVRRHYARWKFVLDRHHSLPAMTALDISRRTPHLWNGIMTNR